MLKSIIIVVFFCTLYGTVYGQINYLKVNLIGQKYERLDLNFQLNNDKKYIVNGISDDKRHWTFTYPDSIYDMHIYSSLLVPTDVDTIIHLISLDVILETDTLRVGNLSFEKNNSVLFLEYKNRSILQKVTALNNKNLVIDSYFTKMTSDRQLPALAEGLSGGYNVSFNIDDTLGV